MRRATDSFDKSTSLWTSNQLWALTACKTLIENCVQDIESRQMTMYDTPTGLHAVFARVNRIFFRSQLSNVELTLSKTLTKRTRGAKGMTSWDSSAGYRSRSM